MPELAAIRRIRVDETRGRQRNWIPTEGVWLVDAQLRSTTQKKEPTAQKKEETPRVIEVRSEVKIKIDPNEGPVIVWIRGEEIGKN